MTINYLQALIAPVSTSSIDTIMRRDTNGLSGNDRDEYVKENRLGYTVCVSTWIAQIPSHPLKVWMIDELKSKGLKHMINLAKEADRALLHCQCESPTDNALITHFIPQYVRTYAARVRALGQRNYSEYLTDTALVKELHQIFTYPGRYTPVYDPRLVKVTFDKFKAGQNSLRSHDSWKLDQYYRVNSCYSRFARRVQRTIADALPWGRICREINLLIQNPRLEFSGGACYGTSSYYGKKVVDLFNKRPDLFTGIFGQNVHLFANGDKECNVCQGHIVPKNSAIMRFIAAEENVRQMICLGIFAILDPYLETIGIHLHNQEIQRSLCQAAGATQMYATTDVSDASDGISRRLYRDIFPEEFVRLTESYLPEYVEIRIDGKTHKIELASRMTMGNAITFPCECIVFYAIDCVARDEYELFTGERFQRYARLYDQEPVWVKVPGIYGDDQIHDSAYAELVYEILTTLGFKPNVDKSYTGSDLYREACGVEMWRDTSITPCKLARKTISGYITKDGITLDSNAIRDSRTTEYYDSTMTLIDLQKRLIDSSLFEAADIVATIVQIAHPDMTFSPIGSTNPDLWGLGNASVSSFETEFAYTSRLQIEVSGPKGTTWHSLPRGTLAEDIVADMENRGVNNSVMFPGSDAYDQLVDTYKAYVRYMGAMDYNDSHYIQCIDGKYTVVPYTVELCGPLYYIQVRIAPSKTYAINRIPTVLDQHLCPSVKYVIAPDKAELLKSDKMTAAVLQEWRYMTFLRHGPSYEDAPDTYMGTFERLHGITKDRWDLDRFSSQGTGFYAKMFGRPVIVWGVKADR